MGRTNGLDPRAELSRMGVLAQGALQSAPSAHVNLAALGGGSLGNGVIEPPRLPPHPGSLSGSSPAGPSGSSSSRGGSCCNGALPACGVAAGFQSSLHGLQSSLHGPPSMAPSMMPSKLSKLSMAHTATDAPTPSAAYLTQRTVNKECMVGMDMIQELFQHQSKRLEAQVYQQLRDQAEIEHLQNQLAAASQQFKRLQLQNMELDRLVEANEANIRAMYSHACDVQQSQSGLLRVCDCLRQDAQILRQALIDACPSRAHEFTEPPRPALPARLPQLPPLEELLPPLAGARVAGEVGHSSGPSVHMDTALALLSTVASHKADTSAAQPDHHGDNGGSDAGSADQDSNQGSNGSNQGSSNPGTEDTVLVNSNGESNGNGSSHSTGSHSKESPDEADSGDGTNSGHGSDGESNGSGGHANGQAESMGSGGEHSKRNGKGSSNGDSDSNGEGMPIGDGSAGTSASRSGSNSSSPPRDLDVKPPQAQVPSGGKRKR